MCPPGWCFQTCIVALSLPPPCCFCIDTESSSPHVWVCCQHSALPAMSRLYAGWRGHCLCLGNPCSLLSCDPALLMALPVTRSPKPLSSAWSYSLSCIHSRQGSMVGSLEAICTLPCSTGFWHLLTGATSEGPLLPQPWHIRPIHQDMCVIY